MVKSPHVPKISGWSQFPIVEQHLFTIVDSKVPIGSQISNSLAKFYFCKNPFVRVFSSHVFLRTKKTSHIFREGIPCINIHIYIYIYIYIHIYNIPHFSGFRSRSFEAKAPKRPAPKRGGCATVWRALRRRR
jgi:hypothetical protein